MEMSNKRNAHVPRGAVVAKGPKSKTRFYAHSATYEEVAKAISSSGCFAAAGGVVDWRHMLDAAIGGLGLGEKFTRAHGALATENPHKRRLGCFLKGARIYIWRCGESFFPTGWCRSLPKLTYKNVYKTLLITAFSTHADERMNQLLVKHINSPKSRRPNM